MTQEELDALNDKTFRAYISMREATLEYDRLLKQFRQAIKDHPDLAEKLYNPNLR